MINSVNIIIDKNKIKNTNTEKIYKTVEYFYSGWNMTPGKSEYLLYSYLSDYFENTIILDIGTGGGGSSKAFGLNLKNKIISFDLSQRTEIPPSDNIEYRHGEFIEDQTIDYSKVSIIMIDVDPHDGLKEPIMLDYLKKINWSGLLLLDDIKCDRFLELEKYWNTLNEEKYDLTDIGHDSGTGLINFGKKHTITIKE
jgi:hypothetical protein